MRSIFLLILVMLWGGSVPVRIGGGRATGEHLRTEIDPDEQQPLKEPPLAPLTSPSKPPPSDNESEISSDAAPEDSKRPGDPVDVTTISVNMGNTKGSSSSTVQLKTVEGKMDSATLSESTSKTLDVSTITDKGEKTSVVQAVSSSVDVFPTAEEGSLVINGSTVSAVGLATNHGEQNAAVMKDVMTSTTAVSGSSGVRGAANHSLNTATLGKEGVVSLMQEKAFLTSEVSVPGIGGDPNVDAVTGRSVGMAVGTLNEDGASLNTTNLDFVYAYQKKPHDVDENDSNILLQCQRKIEKLQHKLRKCRHQKDAPEYQARQRSCG
ncbi:hypothetical protein E2C01_000330 [Portunus trituberculatus]|uniref:Uncharacterized protein n=1 Tax=Portunus trituberculatus TaxID=210409 RepID=A0A5B7CJC1_PORTR|nr:hypothetical protein [Portunus trituberculatus]